MAKVVLRENETVDELLRRFKKQVLRDDTMYECKRREFFLKKGLKRKAKSEEAIRRAKNKKRK